MADRFQLVGLTEGKAGKLPAAGNLTDRAVVDVEEGLLVLAVRNGELPVILGASPSRPTHWKWYKNCFRDSQVVYYTTC